MRRRLLLAVSRACPPTLADRAEDIVQQAMIRMLRIARRHEGKLEFSSSYLRKTAYSAVVDEIRQARRRGEVQLDEHAALPLNQPGPDRRTSSGELGREIRGCLAAMIRPRRRAVALHLAGHSVDEVAGLLGWNAKRAENLIYRGLADLRNCLERKGLGG